MLRVHYNLKPTRLNCCETYLQPGQFLCGIHPVQKLNTLKLKIRRCHKWRMNLRNSTRMEHEIWT